MKLSWFFLLNMRWKLVLKYYISTNRKVRIIVLFTICTILGVLFKESSVMTEGEFSTLSEKFVVF